LHSETVEIGLRVQAKSERLAVYHLVVGLVRNRLVKARSVLFWLIPP
jgi:hypothetical protein